MGRLEAGLSWKRTSATSGARHEHGVRQQIFDHGDRRATSRLIDLQAQRHTIESCFLERQTAAIALDERTEVVDDFGQAGLQIDRVQVVVQQERTNQVVLRKLLEQRPMSRTAGFDQR